jgi:hypothetical protein
MMMAVSSSSTAAQQRALLEASLKQIGLKIKGILGVGSAGSVYECEPEHGSGSVAVKVIWLTVGIEEVRRAVCLVWIANELISRICCLACRL